MSLHRVLTVITYADCILFIAIKANYLMTSMQQRKLTILHFSDVLCIWAYIAQIRIDELKNKFGDQIELQYHFIPLFGSTHIKFTEGRINRDGFARYNQHVLKLA